MFYSAYGLTVQSDFELPELRSILSDGPADVDVISGEVPSKFPDARYLEPWISISGRDVLYVIPGVVRLLVQDGYRVVVDLEDGARESDMRTYLIGSGFGTILHQRALLPLHISAVLSPRGAIAFTGPPGVGKSTMAARINAEIG